MTPKWSMGTGPLFLSGDQPLTTALPQGWVQDITAQYFLQRVDFLL